MRRPISISLAILSLLPSQLPLTQAFPFPIHFTNNHLFARGCSNPCGYYGQICCSASETCNTESNGQATCRSGGSGGGNGGDGGSSSSSSSGGGNSGGNGQWQTFTTTFVQTDLKTITSTGSSMAAAPTSGGDNGQCQASLGETSCGSVCCSAAEACSNGKCVEAGASPSPGEPTPPLQPTSSGEVTSTPTSTVPFIAPVGASGTSGAQPGGEGDNGSNGGNGGGGGGHLSGGAIAGIVIGTIAGVILLVLLCLFRCFKGIWASLLACLGIGAAAGHGKHSSKYGSHSSTDSNRWYGSEPSAAPPPEKKKKEGLFGLGKWADFAFLVGLIALCLGLRKRKNRGEKTNSSSYSTTYSSYPYTSTSSSKSLRARSKSFSSSKTLILKGFFLSKIQAAQHHPDRKQEAMLDHTRVLTPDDRDHTHIRVRAHVREDNSCRLHQTLNNVQYMYMNMKIRSYIPFPRFRVSAFPRCQQPELYS